ncbi:MAG: hypothetical protein PHI35_06435, partial [Victivallaceae bacterium]|nr:hypothetical protein [Victivallaceae bacterium]
AGFTNAERMTIRRAIKTFFFRELNNTNALEIVEREAPGDVHVAEFANFIRNTERGIMPGDPELTELVMRHVSE